MHDRLYAVVAVISYTIYDFPVDVKGVFVGKFGSPICSIPRDRSNRAQLVW